MNKMPLDTSLDPEKIQTILLIDRMLGVLNNPLIDDQSKQVIQEALAALATGYVQEVDTTEN